MLFKEKGFSLIELLIIIAVIGIVSITVMPRWPASSLNLQAAAKQLLNDIRYAQVLSMASGQRYRWIKISSTAYQIIDPSGTAVTLSSGTSQMNLPAGTQMGTLTNLPNSLIVFDSQGAPYVNTATPGTALASTAVIPLTFGSQTASISLSPQTGYQVLQ